MSANPLVRCTVDQCTHYMPGDRCTAAKISVYNDEAQAVSLNSQDTQCKSFQHRKTLGDMVGALANTNVGGAVSAAFIPGTQLTPSVECFVDNCRYWEEGNACHAPSIEVNGANAARESDTDCETFVTI